MIYDFTHASDFEFIFIYYLEKIWKNMFEILNTLSILFSFIKLNKFFLSIFRDFHKSGLISTSVTIVGGRPYSNQNIIWKPKLISLLNQLMSSGYHFKIVNMIELLGYFGAKQPACSSSWLNPCLNIVWIWPHKITEGSLNRNLLVSLYSSNLLNCSYFWWQTSVNS